MKIIRSLPAMMWISLGAAVLAVALALAPGSASIVSATPTETDDCTGVADQGPNFNFHAACAAHDVCYGTYGGLPVTAAKEIARAACDSAFLANMNAWCTTALQQHQITLGGYAACKARAQIYYEGVRTFGALFFYNTGAPV